VNGFARRITSAGGVTVETIDDDLDGAIDRTLRRERSPGALRETAVSAAGALIGTRVYALDAAGRAESVEIDGDGDGLVDWRARFRTEEHELGADVQEMASGTEDVYASASVSAARDDDVVLRAVEIDGVTGPATYLDKTLLGLSVGGLIGYMLPMIWLRTRINANQKALTHGLPDAIDLMVVCVEAGLTVDAAMQRVGQELAIAHPAVSREFGIAHMETRVGLSRAEAMKNMGIRTGSAALQSLTSMLVQADRFGTSIANALRIHSETLRLNRQHAAEELAAKASVKMSFPLVLFIFPATFIVLAGPTVIGLMNAGML
jgi:hypothetical protein